MAFAYRKNKYVTLTPKNTRHNLQVQLILIVYSLHLPQQPTEQANNRKYTSPRHWSGSVLLR